MLNNVLGFFNNRNNCYLNSLLQSLLSLEILNNTELKKLFDCINHINNCNDQNCNSTTYFLYSSIKLSKELKLPTAPQDCHEVFFSILDLYPGMKKYFEVETSITTQCDNCNFKTKNIEIQYNLFINEIEHINYTEPLPGYKCTNNDCNATNKTKMIFNVDKTSSCLAICLTGAYKHIKTKYSEKIEINNIIYNLKSEIVHTGAHYFVNCKRHDKVYNIDDTRVKPSEFSINSDNKGITTFLFYSK